MTHRPWDANGLEYTVPLRLVEPPSWSEHIPFAFWLAAALRPRVLVELGVHTGNSYCAFAQATDLLGLETRAFGVDHWEGDIHAGHYSSVVFDELRAYHDPLYARFSTLLRMGFDEAVGQFPDGSIDLLHIDGLHTYEAVAHDFETWRQKLSSRAVVLFHDTNVRHDDFGVWRFWGEVSKGRDAFEFFHGHGLGVLSVGTDPLPGDLAALFAAANDDSEKARVQRHFSRLGAAFSAKIRADETRRQLLELDQRTSLLMDTHRNAETQIAELRSVEAALRQSEERVVARDAQIVQRDRQVEELTQECNLLRPLEADGRRWQSLASELAGITDRNLPDIATGLERIIRSRSAFAVPDRAFLRQTFDRAVDGYSLGAGLFSVDQISARLALGRLRRIATRKLRSLVGRKVSHAISLVSAKGDASATVVKIDQYHMTPDDLDLERIRASGLFDITHYAARDEAETAGIDPLLHYLLIGERQGISPSSRFDPRYYARRYSDVSADDYGLLRHYVLFGAAEGREGISPAARLTLPSFDHLTRPRILLVNHEASRTGAPILGWNIARALQKNYDVVVALKRGGAIEEAFSDVCSDVIRIPDMAQDDAIDRDEIVVRLAAELRPNYAILNSAETRELGPALSRAGVGVIQLVHEFPATVYPVSTARDMVLMAHQLVFPADVVARAFIADHPYLAHRQYSVLAQGVPDLPPVTTTQLSTKEFTNKAQTIVPGGPDTFLVLGLGSVDYRKGVDLFIAAASAAVRRAPDADLLFVWIGAGYKPKLELGFASYLHDQVERSGLRDRLIFLDEVDNLDAFYDRAAVLALTSRLDPMPNTAIVALKRGVPVVCFDGASGIAEVMSSDGKLQDLVVPFLDADGMGSKIAELAVQRDRLAELGVRAIECANRAFDMDRYVSKLAELGAGVTAEARAMTEEGSKIIASNLFDHSLFRGSASKGLTDGAADIHEYLIRSRSFLNLKGSSSPYGMRRPRAGFNPLIYAEDHSGLDGDPFADWISRGQPEGRWTHPVIDLDAPAAPQVDHIKALIHGHFHHLDVVGDALGRLRGNTLAFDLVLTTTDEERAETLRRVAAEHGYASAEVMVVENRGRDVGAFFTGLASRLESYDVVAHIHGKRSPHMGASGDLWREFLWERLIGGQVSAADICAATLMGRPEIGLIFPEDPNLCGWDANRSDASDFASRMNIEHLPNAFEWPIGTMFWARPAALRPLLDLNIGWGDYPEEPVGEDGTMLHALERLIGFSAEKAGCSYATTHMKAVMR
jgi:glycosyltransferase involved in cell wall biosynthesis